MYATHQYLARIPLLGVDRIFLMGRNHAYNWCRPVDPGSIQGSHQPVPF